MKKEYLLIIGSVTLTLFMALILIRYFAPNLLGIPADLQMVRVSKEVIPFFHNVFRTEDHNSEKFILQDPYIIRAKPLYPDVGNMGPNDILGFRNRFIPNVADIITIGDSQTYGNNVFLEKNWPNQLISMMPNPKPVLYNMAVGGWGAVEYLEIFNIAKLLKPKIVIVAFYSGNDSLGSFMKVYSNEKWDYLRPDKNLSKSDIPKSTNPAPKEERWEVDFRDGVKTVFTPKLRHASNTNHPAVKAGYQIMAEVARKISDRAKEFNIKILFTIIPTKELVYATKIKQKNIVMPNEYRELIKDESKNIELLSTAIRNIHSVKYVDIVKHLQEKAAGTVPFYRENMDGHPVSAGYRQIAEIITPSIHKLFLPLPNGLVALMTGKKRYRPGLIRHNKLWLFRSLKLAEANGWKVEGIPSVYPRDVANLKRAGIISTVDQARFGPME